MQTPLPKSNPSRIVKQLELYRLENRIPKEVLAEALGVSFSTVSRWLGGKTKPQKVQQYHIEKFLKEKIKAKRKS